MMNVNKLFIFIIFLFTLTISSKTQSNKELAQSFCSYEPANYSLCEISQKPCGSKYSGSRIFSGKGKTWYTCYKLGGKANKEAHWYCQGNHHIFRECTVSKKPCSVNDEGSMRFKSDGITMYSCFNWIGSTNKEKAIRFCSKRPKTCSVFKTKCPSSFDGYRAFSGKGVTWYSCVSKNNLTDN